MHIHTQCRDCGGPLLITNNDNTVHPNCEPQPTRIERLAQLWLAAIENGDNARAIDIEKQINELENRPPRLREAALAYAGYGWPVFPLKPRTKIPVTPHGFKDATTNLERIDGWWTNTQYNIGIPTGIAFDVIDIDVPDGPASLATILATTVDPKTGKGLLPDAHGVVATASGGTHYYIEVQGGGNKASIMPGIDTRGRGGYVVAPPSTLGEIGRSWSWTVAPSPSIKPILAAK